MKSLKKRKKTKKLSLIVIISVGAGIIMVALLAWYLYSQKQKNIAPAQNSDSTSKINYGPPTPEQKKASDTQKDAIVQQQSKDSGSTDATLSIGLSRTFQDPSGFNLRTLVGGTDTGECTATFTKTSQPAVVKTFAVVFGGTSASCQNTPIALSDFPVGGTWDLSLIVKKDAKQSAPLTTTVEITK